MSGHIPNELARLEFAVEIRGPSVTHYSSPLEKFMHTCELCKMLIPLCVVLAFLRPSLADVTLVSGAPLLVTVVNSLVLITVVWSWYTHLGS